MAKFSCMPIVHEKSPCCRGNIWRYGIRRRQCSVCKRTWSAWQRKRGRSQRRRADGRLKTYLKGGLLSPRKQKDSNGLTRQAQSARMSLLRDKFCLNTSWPEVPGGKLVLVCDALMQSFAGSIWTLYMFWARSIAGTQAVILPPVFRPGREASRGGWSMAFAAIMDSVKNNVVALISDGAAEACRQASNHGWILQRCQFHLLMSVANYVRPGPLSRHKKLAEQIYPRIYTILYDSPEDDIQGALSELETLVLPQIRSPKLITIISGFLNHYRDYRSYLKYPQYALPATTGSAESFISQIRGLLWRTRGFRTPKSFIKWIEAFLKHQKSIRCNGRNQQN